MQLVNQKVIDDTFGLCFGYPDGGKMLLGDVKLVDADKMQYIALKRPKNQVGKIMTKDLEQIIKHRFYISSLNEVLNSSLKGHLYTVTLESIKIAGEKLEIPSVRYLFLDLNMLMVIENCYQAMFIY